MKPSLVQPFVLGFASRPMFCQQAGRPNKVGFVTVFGEMGVAHFGLIVENMNK